MIEFIQKTGFFGDGGATPEPPLPDPTTVQFTSAQYAAGLTGSVSTTKTAGRIYMRGAVTLWSGFISGTEAKLTSPSDFGDQPGSMQVAINGGAFTLAPNTGSVYTLFTGLPHATRFVEVRYDVQMGEAPYIASTGNVLEVTGQPPTLATLSHKVQNGADSATGFYSGAQVANSATFSPPMQAQKGQNYGSNVGSIKLRGAFTKLAVTVNGSRLIAVSKNGGAPVFYDMADETDNPIRAILVPCDGSTSTYNVWDDGNGRSPNGHFAVAGDAPLLDVGTRRRLDQLPGDSITFGSGPGATSRNTETMRVAAALGFTGSTAGVSGLTISGGSALLDTVLPARTVGANDVAILAIGGNSAAGGIDGPEQAAYADCMDKLLAKGYGKVICRGILPNVAAQELVNAANVTLKAVMDAKADSRLVWVDTTTWAFSTIDGTHPDAAGYATLAGYAIPAYTAALGL